MRLHNALLRSWKMLPFLLLLLWVILILASWVGNAAGFPVGNLLAAEGIRWMFAHALSPTLAMGMAYLLLFLFTEGVLYGSGLLGCMAQFLLPKSKRKPLTHRRKRGFYTSLIFLIVWMLGVALLLFIPQTPLLNIVGEFFPSPFISGFVVLVCVGFMLAGFSYGTLAGVLHRVEECSILLTVGVSRHALCIPIFFLSVQLYQTLVYMFVDVLAAW